MNGYNEYDDHPVRDTPAKRPEELVKRMSTKAAMVSKMDRSELEDKYIRLYEQYLIIKVHAQKQEDRIKKLGIVQQKLINDKKKILDEGGKPRTKTGLQSNDRVEELEAKLHEMERQNGSLKEKLRIMKHQVSLAQEARTMQADSRLRTGVTRQPTLDSRVTKNLRFAGPPSSQRMGQGVSTAVFEDARQEIRNRDQHIQELQEVIANYEAENAAMKDKLKAKDVEFEEEMIQIKQKLNQDQRANIQENIELIKLQRELREKSSSLTQLHAKYSDLDEKMRLLKASHDQLLNELEMTNRNLQKEQSRNSILDNQLKQGTSSHMLLAEREEKVADLERECQLLKEANAQLLSSAFSLEKEKEWRSKEKALKLQIAQLEATLKADVSEKGGILDKLLQQSDNQDKLEAEHRELRCKYYELKNQHDELLDKMKYFTKDSAVNMEELEEALVIVKHRREAQNPELDFLHKVDEERNKDLDKLVKQLQAEHADTINELEKTRNMLILQHKINKDYQAEVEQVTRKMDELKRESDLRLSEYAQLLDIRAARIKKLEAQMRDVAYGTRQYRIKPEEEEPILDEDGLGDTTVNLELGQNLFEIHVIRVALSSEGLKQMQDPEPNIFCTWEFYEFEMQATPILRGPRAEFEFTSQYVVTVDDFFLHYLQKDSCALELHQSFGTDYQTVAACHLRLHDILEKSQGRLHGTVFLTGVSESDSGINYGTVDYWVRLRVPMENALRLYKERSKALGYIEGSISKMSESKLVPMDDVAARRAPENVNQLLITIVQCLNVKSRRKDVQPSPFCVYKFFDFTDHDTPIVPSSNSPHFDDKSKFPVPMTADLDKYLKTQALKVYVLDDADPDETSYLGIANIPLIPLSHDKAIQGTFELITKDGKTNGTVDVTLQWQYAYLPPTATSRTLQQTAGTSKQDSLPLLPGEKEALSQNVVAGVPAGKKPIKSSNTTTTPAVSTQSTRRVNSPSDTSVKSTHSVKSPQSPGSLTSSPAHSMPVTTTSPLTKKVDLENSIASEGEHVSGESEPVSEVSTPRATTPQKSRDVLTRVSNGSERSLVVSENGSTIQGPGEYEDHEPVTDRSDSEESDVVQSHRPSSQQIHSDTVRIVVCQVTIDDNDVLNNDSIQKLYVEYSFLGIPLQDTETPYSLPKIPGKPMKFNFEKVFSVDETENFERRQLLARMMLPDPNNPGQDRLKFVVVSEPPEDDEDVDCMDVGVAYVSIAEILRTGHDVINQPIALLNAEDETREIGALEVTVECLQTLKVINDDSQS